MLSLPDDLFNRVRSYFTFDYLHATRRVSKRWENISSVPKTLDLSYLSLCIPPANANYSRVERIHVTFESQIPAKEERFIQTLRKSSSHLKSVRIDKDPPISVLQHIRDLPSLTCCHISLANVATAEVFIYNAPNLSSLKLTYLDQRFDVDFAKLVKLKNLSMIGIVLGEISNADSCNVESMKLSIDWEPDMSIFHQEEINDDEFPDLDRFWDDCFLRNLRLLCVDFNFNFSDIIDMRSEQIICAVKAWFNQKPDLRMESEFLCYDDDEDSSTKFKFIVEKDRFVIDECDEIHGSTGAINRSLTKFLPLLKMWKKILPFKLEIHPKIDVEKKENLFLLLTCSRLFSLSELSDILLTAKANT